MIAGHPQTWYFVDVEGSCDGQLMGKPVRFTHFKTKCSEGLVPFDHKGKCEPAPDDDVCGHCDWTQKIAGSLEEAKVKLGHRPGTIYAMTPVIFPKRDGEA